jgi:hypothetical protein
MSALFTNGLKKAGTAREKHPLNPASLTLQRKLI